MTSPVLAASWYVCKLVYCGILLWSWCIFQRTPHVSTSALKDWLFVVVFFWLTFYPPPPLLYDTFLYHIWSGLPPCVLSPSVPRIRQIRFSPHFSTMSYSHKLLNVLLRGLVIYAVLGLECTCSNDLPSQSSDAANVATTGKRQSMSDTSVSQFIYACTLLPPPHPPPHIVFPVAFTGKAEEMPRAWGFNVKWYNICRHLSFYPRLPVCTLPRDAWHSSNAGAILAEVVMSVLPFHVSIVNLPILWDYSFISITDTMTGHFSERKPIYMLSVYICHKATGDSSLK